MQESNRLQTTKSGKEVINLARKAKGIRGKDYCTDWQEAFTKNNLGTITNREIDYFLTGKKLLPANVYRALCDFLNVDWQKVSIDEINSSPSLNLNFVGREVDITELDQFIIEGNKVIVIWGEGGIGKTELSFRYLKSYEYTKIIKNFIAKETINISPVESVVSQWLQYDFNEKSDTDFDTNLAKLRKLLMESERRIGIIIDNLEPALDENGRFIENHRSYIKLIRTLSDPDINSTTIITSREFICEPSIRILNYKLKGLSTEDWANFFDISNNSDKYNFLSEIRNAYNGNALAMKTFKSIVNQEYERDIKLCWYFYHNKWLLNQTLENLIKEQFQRLENINPIAYRLLCRMGCYRYQEIPSISLSGLKCLLWEEAEQTEKVIESLKNSSLLECFKGKYWLHPVIRQEAIKRLKNTSDWEIANQKAAKFFSEEFDVISNVDEALFVLESCHHYIQIQDFISAAIVIIQDRNSPYEEIESLGVSLYRLGLFAVAIPLVLELAKNNLTDYLNCRLYNILGEFYLMSGDTYQAVDCYKKSKDIASRHIQEVHSEELSRDQRRTFKNLYIVSFYNIGLSYLDIWELEKAREQFKQVKSFAMDKDSFKPYIYGCEFIGDVYCSILLGDSLNNETRQKFYDIASSFPEDSLIDFSNPWALGFLGIICGLVYMYFGEYENAENTFTEVLTRTQKMNYTQFKANALNSLAILYRKKNEFKEAIIKHEEAITLLKNPGCKRDIAEVYFQLGLTYKVSGKTRESTNSFSEAISIFKEMNAPKQVERVRQAMLS
ncbi:tetratricopeptide repeat protein [Nostoc linckia FACHB-104]|nr:tetratricopeptide repeat protein [Nostoc linckia FACHB-104]